MLRLFRFSPSLRGLVHARVLECSTLAALFLAGAPSTALATPEYPLIIDSVMGTNCPQPLSRCLICHTTARGGQGTAEQPFAVTLRPFGLTHGHDDDALRTALSRLPADTDSDDDGTPDKEELQQCGNPSGQDLGPGPVYGCNGARLAPQGQPDLPLSMLALAVAVGLIRGGARAVRRRDE